MCFGIRFYKSCGCPGLSLLACPLVGMTPPPVRRYKGFPLQAAAVGTQRLCLLITTLQAGQTWTGLLFPTNRENPDSLFAPPAASRISTKTLCPAAWCISAPYPRTRIMRPCFFQPPAGRKGTSDRLRLSKVLLRYFRESNKAFCCRWLRSAPAR